MNDRVVQLTPALRQLHDGAAMSLATRCAAWVVRRLRGGGLEGEVAGALLECDFGLGQQGGVVDQLGDRLLTVAC